MDVDGAKRSRREFRGVGWQVVGIAASRWLPGWKVVKAVMSPVPTGFSCIPWSARPVCGLNTYVRTYMYIRRLVWPARSLWCGLGGARLGFLSRPTGDIVET